MHVACVRHRNDRMSHGVYIDTILPRRLIWTQQTTMTTFSPHAFEESELHDLSMLRTPCRKPSSPSTRPYDPDVTPSCGVWTTGRGAEFQQSGFPWRSKA